MSSLSGVLEVGLASGSAESDFLAEIVHFFFLSCMSCTYSSDWHGLRPGSRSLSELGTRAQQLKGKPGSRSLGTKSRE